MRPTGRTRGRATGPNALEREYMAHLEVLKSNGTVAWFAFESVKFRLADRTWYTPDFLVMFSDGKLEAHETKGFWEDDALVKIKVAADLYPIPFVAIKKISKKNGGGWDFETK